jgi:hypothetical protein
MGGLICVWRDAYDDPLTGAMQIESYRTRIEEFDQNLSRELYRYCAGLKDQLDLTAVYSEYSDLFSRESIREIKSELDNANGSFPSRRKSLKKIHEFLIDQHLDLRAASLTQDILRSDAQQTLVWEGKTIVVSQMPSLLSAESSAGKRRQLCERYVRMLADTAELKLERIALRQSAAESLGFKNYVEAREYISGVDYGSLLETLDAALSRLDDAYIEQLRISIESTLGIPLRDSGSWDMARWQERNDQEHIFSEKNLLPVVDATVTELGVRPERPDSISLDLERRTLKQARPCCIPIRIPQEIKIILSPMNGSRHYAALLHESGHAHHFAWTSASLPVEHRIWGDRALPEAYAFLFEHFLLDRTWLIRMLSFFKSEDYVRFRLLLRVFLVRRCMGRLQFALKLHTEKSVDDISRIYSETMQSYTGINHPPELWLADLSDEFDSADYLRGWIFESMLREYMTTRFGRAWNQSRAASGFLKEIWETGQLYRSEELCREIGIGVLDPQILADELMGGLRY